MISDDRLFRFWDRVLVGDGCWEFQGWRSPTGYGLHTLQRKGYKTERLAHRVSYMLWHGLDEMPLGKQINHHCDNPPCVRPGHLYLGTKSENARDAYARGQLVPYNRVKTHCRHGHEFTEENTHWFQSTKNDRWYRYCRTCKRDKSREQATDLRARQSEEDRERKAAYMREWWKRRRENGSSTSR